jgi:hypothetical protein
MLSLTLASTHRTLSRRDGRVVVGCDVCPSGRQQAASLIFARYDHLWFAHSIATESVRCNDKQPLPFQPVADGEVWEASGERFLLQIESEPIEAEVPRSEDFSCRIKLSISSDSSKIYSIQPPSIVIGRALFCDVRVDDPRMAPQQAMICKVNGQWYFHDLTCGGGEYGFDGFELIATGEIRQLGRSRLEFILQKTAPAPAIVSSVTEEFIPGRTSVVAESTEAEKSAVSEDTGDGRGETSETGPMPLSMASRTENSPPVSTTVNTTADVAKSGPDSTMTVRALPESDENGNSGNRQEAVPDENVRAAAQTCLNLITSISQLRTLRRLSVWEQLRRKFNVWLGIRRAEKTFLERRRIKAFEELQTLIMLVPFDKSLMLTLARMCELSGLEDHCLHVLRILNERSPNDHIVLRSLARITLHLSEREPSYARKSEAYWKKVQELCPEEKRDIEATIRSIQSRMLNCGYKKRHSET